MIGEGLLIAAFVCAVVSLIAGGLRRSVLARWSLATACVFSWLTVIVLGAALVRQDTSLAYVVEQTRLNSGVVRRITGLWSGAEGSLLVFTAIIITALLAGHRWLAPGVNAPRWQQLGVAAIAAGLLAALWRAATPFETLDLAPAGGVGMAPILEHAAMAIHPPMLYVGMALALTPGLVADRIWAQRLTMVAAATLGTALAIGASWAYVELGWGGWWAWDPIENVGLVVWLLLTAALHANLLDARTGTGLLSAPVLWALCWPSVLAGTALTRTSLRTSVHAFADAEGLGLWLWPLAGLAAVGAVLRIATERPTMASSPQSWPRLLPAGLLGVAAGIVATGTYRPLVPGDLTSGWFYSRSLFPIAIAGAVAAGLVTRLVPVDGRYLTNKRLLFAALGVAAGLTAAGVARWLATYQLILSAAVGAGLAATASDLGRGVSRRQLGRALSHGGVLLVLMAALGGTAGSDTVARLNEGETTTIEGHTLRLDAIEVLDGARPEVTATVTLFQSKGSGPNQSGTVMRPQVVFHPERGLRLPEIATHSRPWLDVLVILRDVDPVDGALLTIRLRPLTQLVWWGAGFTALGLIVGAASPTGTKENDEP